MSSRTDVELKHGLKPRTKLKPKPKRKLKPQPKLKPEAGRLEGLNAIAKFLRQTPAVAQRWQESGMPVERSGRRVSASPEELTRWVGTEAGKANPSISPRTRRTCWRTSRKDWRMCAEGRAGKK